MVIIQANAATVPEEISNQREEKTEESPVVEEKWPTTEVEDVKPTESKTAEPDEFFFPDEEDNKLSEEDKAAVSPLEEDLKLTEDIGHEDHRADDLDLEDDDQ